MATKHLYINILHIGKHDAERITQKGMATYAGNNRISSQFINDAKRITQKGMAIRYRSLGIIIVMFYWCRKNHPKGDGNELISSSYNALRFSRCRKNHPKGDGSIPKRTHFFCGVHWFLLLIRRKENYPKGDGGNVSILDMNTLKCLADAKRIT